MRTGGRTSADISGGVPVMRGVSEGGGGWLHRRRKRKVDDSAHRKRQCDDNVSGSNSQGARMSAL
jgi:hypothetical protein